ncbi:ArsR/SmtB family transcription factor [Agaribacterium haliotis]|uniref:ArsR/SmtB family transcription factor n=1 Tax=Agaribacterium haliotis TaxID=2013869 RepID=UPI000BB5329F|nr:metalloregulator ArsR/SmtB family transcription factor [Agaribacterium haliotis]
MNAASTTTVDVLSQALKAAGDDLRLQVLALLAQDSYAVQELCQIFASKQSGMSHHLKVLNKAQLVSTRREGNTNYYRRSDEACSQALDHLRDSIYQAADALHLSDEVQAQLGTLYQQRAAASLAFFKDNAAAFKEQQDLIAAYDVYGPEVASLLGRGLKALEVGPGNGEFLSELAARFEQVIALDTSAQMLEQSKELCSKQNIDNVNFVNGDTAHCRALANSLDAIVINMVLHHTPSPATIFADVSSALKPGAMLLVCELGAHDQDWVKQACGDQWLGFASSELKQWAKLQALTEGASRYFALRNGFQIQIHQFFKQH